VPPATRIEAALHPWVAYGILPLFAFSNAGVSLSGLDWATTGAVSLTLGITLGLVVGKPLGIILVSALSVKLRLCALPTDVSWRAFLVAGCLAGIGFTMSIFIAELAFPDDPLLVIVKLAVLLGSGVAALVGLIVGRAVLRLPDHDQE
jgi:NhaA family Na+:H+ antiporter